ncbi:MAG: DUF3575 domain-containing protein [Bacteroidales bacterium]|nr:DUF3575 domain-containing protein [Bacteroidales bacterium]
MKSKITLAIVASLFMGTLAAQTSNAENQLSTNYKPNHLLFSPFYFVDGTFMLTYERIFASSSLRVTPSIKLQNLSDEFYTQREGWGIDVGYKFFLTQRPKRGIFYLGPYALYKNINVKESGKSLESSFVQDISDTYNIMGLGVDTGVKFIFGRFTMDISIGGGIRYAFIDGYTFKNSGSDWYDVDYKGIVPRGNLSVGIAF